MQIIYPELSIKEEKEILKKAYDEDDTMDAVSEKDLERSLERTKSLKEASYLENEDNEKKEKEEKKRCVKHLKENCCCTKEAKEPKQCCLLRIPCVQKLLNRNVVAKAEEVKAE